MIRVPGFGDHLEATVDPDIRERDLFARLPDVLRAAIRAPGYAERLKGIEPADFTVHTALRRLGADDPWAAQMPNPQRLSADLIEEGRAIPVARVQAMHEGKRRARNR